MDITLQKHNAKHVCDIPDGLRELCADISREVIRCQPKDCYCFAADYLDTLLITRENAKVAIQVVQNVMLKSEQIVEILSSTGIKLEKIAAAAPRLQKAFKEYLLAVDRKKECGCDGDSDVADDESQLSICKILEETGATYKQAYTSAVKIQALFRGHYDRMRLGEKRGEVQWQRAAANTMEILRKSGISRNVATHAAIVIQSVYRGYYTRKILRRKQEESKSAKKDAIDMTAWLSMMFEINGLTIERANEAAIVIQVAYRKYRERKSSQSYYTKSKDSSMRFGSQDRLDGGTLRVTMSVAKSGSLSDTSQIDTYDDDSDSDEMVKFKPNVAISVDTGASSDKTEESSVKIQEGSVKIQESSVKFQEDSVKASATDVKSQASQVEAAAKSDTERTEEEKSERTELEDDELQDEAEDDGEEEV